jgi:hypothetical protein
MSGVACDQIVARRRRNLPQEARAVMTRMGQLALVGGVLLGLAKESAASSVEPESILDAIIWMEHHSGLVSSARGEFTVRYLPTTTEEMQRLAAFCQRRENDYRASGYYVSSRQANRRSYHSAWWRKGVKEREEKTHIARPAIVETTVFDGQVVKTLDGTPGRSCLYIASAATHWTYKSRVQPFALAFEYRSTAHEALLRESPERRVARRRQLAEGFWEITMRHPADDRLVLQLTYDDQRRLIQRDVILTRSSPFLQLDDEEPALYARWEFSRFHPHDDGRGNTIWFPAKAMLRYYLGNLSDGSPVQSFAMKINLDKIEFNVAVPDEKFTLAAPEGVPVHDHRDSRYTMIGVSY